MKDPCANNEGVMACHYPNPRCFKKNWTYTVAEAARQGKLHEQTIRNWLRQGLKPLDNSRPTIIAGAEFTRFLNEKRNARKRPCRADQLFCLRCKIPQVPAGRMADFIHVGINRAYLEALCPDCEGSINQRVSLSRLHELKAILNIQEQHREPHIIDLSCTSSNCNLEGTKK